MASLARALPLARPTQQIHRLLRLSPLITCPRRSLFHTTPTAYQRNKENTSPAPAATGGSYARTDDAITVEYPADGELPSATLVPGTGRAGANVFPTLATFSLQGKVAVVTGGARGLGLVMGQGMVVSGAELAIVDLNSMFPTSLLFMGERGWRESKEREVANNCL